MDKNFWPPILALLIPIVALLIPIVAIVVRHAFKLRQEQLRHETLRHFAERGQVIPLELLSPMNAPVQMVLTPELKALRLSRLLHSSVWLMALGLGLGLMLLVMNLEDGRWVGDTAWAIGIVPLILGAGLWSLWRVESRSLAPNNAGQG